MRNFILLLSCLTAISAFCQSEEPGFTHQDSLRGSITPERAWWDLQRYELAVAVDIENKSISGSNLIIYKVLSKSDDMQIDLQEPMTIDRVTQNGRELEVIHDGNAHFIQMAEDQNLGDEMEILVEFSGIPREAYRAPWEGGFTWSEDANGKHFIATSNHGIGASLWWPCKDHYYDEPEKGLKLSINVPEDLTAVGNGRLIEVIDQTNGNKTFVWSVVNPINNYGINLNIGDYVNFSEIYDGEDGDLDMDYWVLSYNLERAKIHFKDARRTMEAFEHWFGKYPFYEDSYKLVEAPYLGMEHQSSVTYGNGYVKGYRGNDMSGTGWGLKWDYIIIHETGHEWFANNVTHLDPADLWIHEGFTTYSESLFTEYFYGKEAGAAYVIGLRGKIQNSEPLIGTYNVNDDVTGDIYSKGSNILHTLRQLVDDDEKWREALRAINSNFYHQCISSEQLENFLAGQLDLNLDSFFNQYLRDNRLPNFEYEIKNSKMNYRWTNCIDTFDMPIKISISGEGKWIYPTTETQTLEDDVTRESISIDPNFYVSTSNQ